MTVLHVILRLLEDRQTDLALIGHSPPRYILLHEVVRDAIRSGQLPHDATFPPLRKLSEALGYSRPTVARAVEMLKSEGLLISNPRSNIKIAKTNLIFEFSKSNSELLMASISQKARSFSSSVVRMRTQQGESLAFRAGTPPLDLFPVERWKKLTSEYWNRIKFSELAYSPSSGMSRLKENLADYLSLARGVRCHPRQVFVTAGSLQSIYQAVTALVDSGDKVFVESPTFPNVISIFSGMQADLGILTSETSGDELAAAKVIHLTPSSTYPFGESMTLERRNSILEALENSGAIIIENEYEHEFNILNEYVPSLYELNKGQRVIYLGTFNRLLHPSIRVGFMVVPPFLVETMEALSLHSHRFVPPSLQWVMNSFLEKTYLHHHLVNARRELKLRRATFVAHWERYNHMLQQGKWELVLNPSFGLSVSLKTTHSGSDSSMVTTLIERGIVAHRLSQCYVEENAVQGLILGYCCIHDKLIPSKVLALVEGLQAWENNINKR